MGGKGKSSGLKRKPAPKFWPIHRKEFTWTVNPTSGPHPLAKCIPLAIVLRDVLKFAETRKEAKTIVAQGKICVDGKVRRRDDFPVGLMDVISLREVGKNFRDKTVTNKGQIQLHLHDGSNLLVKVTDPKNPQEDVYGTLDTLKVGIPEKQVLEHTKMKEKDFAVITGGKNVGKFGRIIEIEKAEGKKRRNALVTVEDEKGTRYQTTLEFIFAIGDAHPFISLSEGD
jgi:small subunit ribosomal protein S4e